MVTCIWCINARNQESKWLTVCCSSQCPSAMHALWHILPSPLTPNHNYVALMYQHFEIYTTRVIIRCSRFCQLVQQSYINWATSSLVHHRKVAFIGKNDNAAELVERRTFQPAITLVRAEAELETRTLGQERQCCWTYREKNLPSIHHTGRPKGRGRAWNKNDNAVELIERRIFHPSITLVGLRIKAELETRTSMLLNL